MIKIVRSFPAPESLAEEAKKVNGRYDKQDVVERLKSDFHNKCYICEIKELQDPNVEHLLPHKNGKYPERKYDWENLFWSCGHCNGIKNNSKYDEGIIDCCKQDPEKYLYFRIKDNDVVIDVSDSNDEIQKRTALLVTETFSMKNTGMRTYTSDERLKLLQKEMNVLYKQLEKIHDAPDSKVVMRTIRSLLRRESAFAAFKRCYVREHAAEYPELQKYVSLDTPKPPFLYHGSQYLLTELLPHAACGEGANDSILGIYAAETPELVIPFALPIRWYPDSPDGKRAFNASDGKTTLLYGSLNPHGVGYIYKVKSDSFYKVDDWQWVSPVKTIPVERMEIKVADYMHTVTFSEAAYEIQQKLYPSIIL